MWGALESGSFDVSLALTWDLSRHHFQSLVQKCLGYHTSHALSMTSSAERSFNRRQHRGTETWLWKIFRGLDRSLDIPCLEVVVWAPLMSAMWSLLRRAPSIGDSMVRSIESDLILLVLSGIISQQFWVQDGAPQANLRYSFHNLRSNPPLSIQSSCKN